MSLWLVSKRAWTKGPTDFGNYSMINTFLGYIACTSRSRVTIVFGIKRDIKNGKEGRRCNRLFLCKHFREEYPINCCQYIITSPGCIHGVFHSDAVHFIQIMLMLMHMVEMSVYSRKTTDIWYAHHWHIAFCNIHNSISVYLITVAIAMMFRIFSGLIFAIAILQPGRLVFGRRQWNIVLKDTFDFHVSLPLTDQTHNEFSMNKWKYIVYCAFVL